MPEIPSDKPFELIGHYHKFHDLDLAAACQADSGVPRLPEEAITTFVEGDNKREISRYYQFLISASDRVSEIFSAWAKCKRDGPALVNDEAVATTFRAFRYYDKFSDLIKERVASRWPVDIENLHWTTNTKVISTALAMATKELIPKERMAKMVYRRGKEYGYLLRDRALIDAFADPDAYFAAGPTGIEAYIVAGFFHRERLRDFVKAKPAQHIFRNGSEISFIAEPAPRAAAPAAKPTKEIPAHV